MISHLSLISMFVPSWVGWLGWVCCFGVICWKFAEIVKRRMQNQQVKDMRESLARHMRARAATASTRTISLLAVGLIFGGLTGFAGGYQYRMASEVKQRFTYSDALVVERYDDLNFLIQPARMQPKEWTSCYPLDFERGQKMKSVTYQQRKGCKDLTVNGEYDFWMDGPNRIKFPIPLEVANVR
jgi:hypothetical protein